MPPASTFTDVQEHFAEFFGRAASLYNLSPLVGRLYGYVFLAPEPMTLDDLCQATGAAKSTVSVAVRTLEHYRLIRRQWQKGNRKDFFVPRTDASKVLGELFQLFFSHELQYMKEANDTARIALESSRDDEGWPDEEKRRELLSRLDLLEGIMSLVRTWMQQIIESPPAALRPVESIKIEVEE